MNATAAIEARAAAAHHKSDTEAAVSIAALEKDLEYAQTRKTELEAAVPNTRTDLNSSNYSLVAGEEMYQKLYELCLKPESYEDRKAQRDAEISALREALEMMESGAVLLQEGRGSAALLQDGRKQKRNATNATNVTKPKQPPRVRTAQELDAATLALFGSTVQQHKRGALRQSPLLDAVGRVVAIL